MSRSLSSFPEERRLAVATRRLNQGSASNVRGNGFWAAKDYFDKHGLKYPGKMGAAQAIADALENASHDETGFHTDTRGDGKLRRRPPKDQSDRKSGAVRKPHFKQRKSRGAKLADVWPVSGGQGRPPMARRASGSGNYKGKRQPVAR